MIQVTHVMICEHFTTRKHVMTHFLVWYDPDIRRTIIEKIGDARDAYTRRFSVVPNLVLLSEGDEATLSDGEVRNTRMVQPHHIWVGRVDEAASTGRLATRESQPTPTS